MKKIYFFLVCGILTNTATWAQWSLNGNTITDSNFLGTLNNKSLRIKVNGVLAGLLDASSNGNTYYGIGSVSRSPSVFYNAAFGYGSQRFCTGSNNTSMGENSLHRSIGRFNNAFGGEALFFNDTGANNNAFGYQALYRNSTGTHNCAFGNQALFSNTNGYDNVAMGLSSLSNNTTGAGNTAVGEAALYHNTTAMRNSAFGFYPMFSNTTGFENCAAGTFALYYNTIGNYNSAFGNSALVHNSTGSLNTAIGYFAGPLDPALTNTSAIGFKAIPKASNQVVIGNTSVTSIGGFANWTNFSDGRFKKDIKGDVPGLAFIKLLRPVTYNLDIPGINNFLGTDQSLSISSEEESAIAQKARTLYTGFVAQEVEAAAKKLNYNFSGLRLPENEKDYYGLRYGDFVPPLVKTAQELARSVDDLKASNDSLRSIVADLQTQIRDIQSQLPNLKRGAASFGSGHTPVLLQNTPNPFNGTTTVTYYVPDQARSAQLVIGDMKGRILNTIIIGAKGPGQISFDGSQLTAGTYYYSLVINGSTFETKKMLVVK